jgi:hypothetical protein
MKRDTPAFDPAFFEAETARFRRALAKGRSANQLALFDFLVERAGDDRSPKEIEIALSLFGEGATKDSSGDSGARVYVHRLRKRMDDYYSGKSGPRLAIPTGEYRIVLTDTGLQGKVRTRLRRLGDAIIAHPARSAGFGAILCAALILAGWLAAPERQAPSFTLERQGRPLPGALAAVSSPIVVIGDSMLVAESEDQRGVQRMILDPEIRSRDDLGRYLRAHPDAFYRLYDFNLNFAPISAVEAAWAAQDELAGADNRNEPAGALTPASALTAEALRSRDVLYVGRLSQLGALGPRVFAESGFRLTAYNQLTDAASGRAYTGQVYSDAQGAPRLDYGYLAVRTGPEGHTLAVLAGLGDQGTLAMAELLSSPRDLAQLKARLGDNKRFEALFEVRTNESQAVERRLLALRPLR